MYIYIYIYMCVCAIHGSVDPSPSKDVCPRAQVGLVAGGFFSQNSEAWAQKGHNDGHVSNQL